jgi:hypothetical protein
MNINAPSEFPVAENNYNNMSTGFKAQPPMFQSSQSFGANTQQNTSGLDFFGTGAQQPAQNVSIL